VGMRPPKYQKFPLFGKESPLQTHFGEDPCTQFRVIVVTDPPTHPSTNIARPPETVMTDYNTLCRYYKETYCGKLDIRPDHLCRRIEIEVKF